MAWVEMMAWLAIVVVSPLEQKIGNECCFCGMNAPGTLENLVFGVLMMICTCYSKNLNPFDYEGDERSHECRLTS